jgi:hypothetical protein
MNWAREVGKLLRKEERIFGSEEEKFENNSKILL